MKNNKKFRYVTDLIFFVVFDLMIAAVSYENTPDFWLALVGTDLGLCIDFMLFDMYKKRYGKMNLLPVSLPVGALMLTGLCYMASVYNLPGWINGIICVEMMSVVLLIEIIAQQMHRQK